MRGSCEQDGVGGLGHIPLHALRHSNKMASVSVLCVANTQELEGILPGACRQTHALSIVLCWQ